MGKFANAMNYNKSFYKKLISLSVPIMFQNLLANAVSFLDTLMVGQFGSDEIAAVGAANQVFFLVSLFSFGIASGASVFLSRYFGEKSYQKMEKVMGFCLVVTIVGGLIWAAASMFAPKLIMNLFTFDENVVAIGAGYQRIVSLSYIFYAVSQSLSIGFRSINKAKIPLLATFISLLLKVIGNWILIFGIGPFRGMGVIGAAIVTFIARLVELVILCFSIVRLDVPFKIRSSEAFRWNRKFLISYISTCLPVFSGEMVWALGMTVYKIAFSKLGIEALAAVSVIESISNLIFVSINGVGNAATIMIGNAIGVGKTDNVCQEGKILMKISIAIGVIMGIIIFAVTPFVPLLFEVSESVREMISSSLVVIALFQPIKAQTMVAIVGLFRGAGDTSYAFSLELISVWLIGVPLSFLGACLGLPLWAVYLLQNGDEAFKVIASWVRIHNRKWISKIDGDW